MTNFAKTVANIWLYKVEQPPDFAKIKMYNFVILQDATQTHGSFQVYRQIYATWQI